MRMSVFKSFLKKYKPGIFYGSVGVIGVLLLLEGPPLGFSFFYSMDFKELKHAKEDSPSAVCEIKSEKRWCCKNWNNEIFFFLLI